MCGRDRKCLESILHSSLEICHGAQDSMEANIALTRSVGMS